MGWLPLKNDVVLMKATLRRFRCCVSANSDACVVAVDVVDLRLAVVVKRMSFQYLFCQSVHHGLTFIACSGQ